MRAVCIFIYSVHITFSSQSCYNITNENIVISINEKEISLLHTAIYMTETNREYFHGIIKRH